MRPNISMKKIGPSKPYHCGRSHKSLWTAYFFVLILLCPPAYAETVTHNGFDISLSREGLCGYADVCCNDMKNQGKVIKYFCLPNLVKFKDIFGLTKGTPRDKAIWDLAGDLTHYYE